MRTTMLALSLLLTTACAPRCHVRQIQWFDFENAQTLERTVAMTVCDGGVHLSANRITPPAAPPTLKTPLVLTVRQSVGMAPFTLRVKVKAEAEAEGREVCVVVDGPESAQSCRELQGITWTLDFTLRSGGDYVVYATSGQYRTSNLPVQVVGAEGDHP